jgi:hypothetical protein
MQHLRQGPQHGFTQGQIASWQPRFDTWLVLMRQSLRVTVCGTSTVNLTIHQLFEFGEAIDEDVKERNRLYELEAVGHKSAHCR